MNKICKITLSTLLILSVSAHAGRPTYRASAGITFSTTAPTATLPTGHTLNDILLLGIETSNQPIAAPTGYTEVSVSPQATGTAAAVNTVAIQLFWKRDNGSESAPTIPDSGDHTGGFMAAYSGCVTSGNPWVYIEGQVISTAQTNPSFTSTANVRIRDGNLVSIMADGFDSTSQILVSSFSQSGNASIGARRNRAAQNSTAGTGGGYGLMDADYGDVDATGTYTATETYANSTKYAWITLVLRPVSHRIVVTSWWQLLFDRWIAALNLP